MPTGRSSDKERLPIRQHFLIYYHFLWTHSTVQISFCTFCLLIHLTEEMENGLSLSIPGHLAPVDKGAVINTVLRHIICFWYVHMYCGGREVPMFVCIWFMYRGYNILFTYIFRPNCLCWPKIQPIYSHSQTKLSEQVYLHFIY